MLIFQFIFATFLFSNGFRSANKIGQAVNVSPTRILQWSDTPIWTHALRLWGHKGTIRLNHFDRYQHRKNAGNVKALHERRMNRAKDTLVKGFHSSRSLKSADGLWSDLFSGNGKAVTRFLRDDAEVTHDTDGNEMRND